MELIMSKKAFSDSFNKDLAKGKYSRWAVDLEEDTLMLLLWMVGEYGIRITSFKEISDPEEPDNLHLIEANQNFRAKEALRIIAAIFRDKKMSFQEGTNSMLRAIFRHRETF
jgi:hypothetical protein